MIEEIDQLRLTAKVEWQGNQHAARSLQRFRRPAKHIHVCAAKAIDRLLSVAHDKQICACAGVQDERLQQVSLQPVSVLELVDKKEFVTLRSALQYFGSLQKCERPQLQVVEIER